MRRTLISFIELAIPFVVVAAAWEAFSLFGPFLRRNMPEIDLSLSTVGFQLRIF